MQIAYNSNFQISNMRHLNSAENDTTEGKKKMRWEKFIYINRLSRTVTIMRKIY